MYKTIIKPILDFSTAFICLLLVAPIFILVTFILYFTNNGQPFFFQLRPGKNEKVFKIIKFKTMNDMKDSSENLLPDAQRLTKVGSFVRKTSIDEIPQLLNILKGDMSFIGPRPLLIKYLPYFYEEERIRHTIKPGITGLAQINGRNTLRWDERLAYDIEYVKTQSFIVDLNILYKTFLKVLKSENIVVDPESVMKNLDDERR